MWACATGSRRSSGSAGATIFDGASGDGVVRRCAAVPFTVFGAAPTRDGAVLGFSVSTAIAEAMGVYLRYEGTIAGQDSSHALTAGLRMSW